jgi:bifunctional DNA-binding transcriptional regulator/antitoxin component of YhaV-PrlF toxin-antitoxin module
MPHFETRMGADGKLVVPEDVQTAFKLKPGDIIDFYLDETARTARIRARNLDFSTIREMFPVGQAPTRPMSIKDMDDAIGEHLEEDDERIRRDAKEWEEFQHWRRMRSDRAAE